MKFRRMLPKMGLRSSTMFLLPGPDVQKNMRDSCLWSPEKLSTKENCLSRAFLNNHPSGMQLDSLYRIHIS